MRKLGWEKRDKGWTHGAKTLLEGLFVIFLGQGYW